MKGNIAVFFLFIVVGMATMEAVKAAEVPADKLLRMHNEGVAVAEVQIAGMLRTNKFQAEWQKLPGIQGEIQKLRELQLQLRELQLQSPETPEREQRARELALQLQRDVGSLAVRFANVAAEERQAFTEVQAEVLNKVLTDSDFTESLTEWQVSEFLMTNEIRADWQVSEFLKSNEIQAEWQKSPEFQAGIQEIHRMRTQLHQISEKVEVDPALLDDLQLEEAQALERLVVRFAKAAEEEAAEDMRSQDVQERGTEKQEQEALQGPSRSSWIAVGVFGLTVLLAAAVALISWNLQKKTKACYKKV